jgi:hypothetical protein
MSFLNYFLLWTGIRLVGAAYLTEWSRLPNAFALDRHHGNKLGGSGGGNEPKSVLEFAGPSSLNCDIPKRDAFFSESYGRLFVTAGTCSDREQSTLSTRNFIDAWHNGFSQIEGYVSCNLL